MISLSNPIKENQLFESLYNKCQEDSNFLHTILDEYFSSLNESEIASLNDFLNDSDMKHQAEINDSIVAMFDNLSVNNESLYEKWVCELYTEDGDMIKQKWNQETLDLMWSDVIDSALTLED